MQVVCTGVDGCREPLLVNTRLGAMGVLDKSAFFNSFYANSGREIMLARQTDSVDWIKSRAEQRIPDKLALCHTTLQHVLRPYGVHSNRPWQKPT